MNINATILGQTISFIFFVWFCMKYIWFPLISTIEKRQKKISDKLESAKKLTLESEKIKKEALLCLKTARIQSDKIIKYANECKVKILNDAQLLANQERNKILFEATFQINQERNRVSDELRKKISKLVIESTEKILDKSIDKIVDYSFVDKIINTLPYKD